MGQSWANPGSLQSLLDALWEIPDEPNFEKRAMDLIDKVSPLIRNAISVASGHRVSFAKEHSRRPMSPDEWLAEDAFSITKATLWAAMGKMRGRQSQPVRSEPQFSLFTIKVAKQCWHGVLRKEKKEWVNTRRSLVRLAKSSQQLFAIWNSSDNKNQLIGLRQWEGLPRLDEPWQIESICEQVQIRAREQNPLLGLAGLDRSQLCVLTFEIVKGPIGLNELVSAVNNLENRLASPSPSRAANPDDHLYYGEMFHLCWKAFLRLTIRQRRVLLLKWHDIEWFEIYCQISIATIAAALNLPLDALLNLYDQLPLPDDEIAALIGLEVQTVRNLRAQSLRAFHQAVEDLARGEMHLMLHPPREFSAGPFWDSTDSLEVT